MNTKANLQLTVIGLFIFCYTLLFATNTWSEAYFEKNKLQFTNEATWTPSTPNQTLSATKANVPILLKDGTPVSTIDNFIAPFTGAIMAFSLNATSDIPSGWLPCDGSEVKKVDYPILYAVIKDSWGTAVDSNNFVLPNFNSFVLRGADTRSPRTLDTDNRFKEDTFVSLHTNSNPVASYQPQAIGSHYHRHDITNETISDTLKPDGSDLGTHDHTVNNTTAPVAHANSTTSSHVHSVAAKTFSTHSDYDNTFGASKNHDHQVTAVANISTRGNNPGYPKNIRLVYCIKH